ncbi:MULTISPECIES: DUF461 domain-containing protein [unclassified Streptomyces]|uniref:DUF461 domain-containing protein n=1 Tax=unclassified Streptomyces TaxID=2593676 RepID=UPI0033AF6EF6
MSSSLRRGSLAAAAIAFSIASLAACGAGNNAETLQVKPDNAATSVGEIKVQNALVITQPDPEAGGPAAISGAVFNGGSTPQTLDSITVAGETATIKPAKGSGKLTIPPHGSVLLGGKGNASAVLESTPEAVKDGNAQKTTFSFSKTGDVTLRAFVVPAESYFSDWGPTAVPAGPGASSSASPSGKPSKSAGASASPSDEATGTPTDAASASASASHSAAGH